ncbi:hypothetical protein [Agrobacterium tumefaciens]|uniref:Uncharacterized protein n=1 Tax=Agrobacterium tumefaciens TaxID=358 RepID=A0AA44F308_AGRTU|nr:hypothetical protein [Agrobacterium tumefaciens]NTB89251.1 hypothetical protein [Agrobacterium tumefaciens]NTC27892.1 hypothetical protein [Agrobacterium tumefaciens]NTC53508.1 hypothetical protein [Agrobacterium tumefaciens]NTC71287.1 hypothetical protein [Agrobacterium tumefaciens]NTD04500.1 hypothetical protein [Agrobacterium tumefaciens]
MAASSSFLHCLTPHSALTQVPALPTQYDVNAAILETTALRRHQLH